MSTSGLHSWQLPLDVPHSGLDRRTLHQETALVLLAGLGASAIWSVLTITQRIVATEPLNEQTTVMNVSRSDDEWLDLAYQLVEIGLGLVTVALALHLLARELFHPARTIGFDRSRPVPDLALGALLAAVIGLPGLAFYVLARELGFNTEVATAGLGDYWWAIPVLVLAACQNAILEEVVMVGYLFTRWSQAGWRVWHVVVVSALIRGTYHLYQGFGGFVGNVLMGLLLGAVYARTRRVMPLVVAHALLDIVAFGGYALFGDEVSWLQ